VARNRTLKIFFSAVVVLSSIFFASPAVKASINPASTPVNFFRPCVGNEDQCIESISAVMPDGKVISGKLTGRTVNGAWGGNDAFLGVLQGQVDEWEFQGLRFENGTNRAIMRTYYWPPSDLHCWNDGNCSLNEEEWGLYFDPSWLDGYRPVVSVNPEDSKIVCPNTESNCNLGSPPWRFNSTAKFRLVVRMPNSFTPLYTQGRAKEFSLTKIESLNSNGAYQVFQEEFSPITLQNVDYQLPDISVIQRSLYTTDEPAIWTYGMNNSKVSSLGPCGKSGGLDVVTNAYYMWNPTWNSENGAINVKLQSTHNDENGSLSKGYLEVRVPVEMAKCMWGVDVSGNINAKFTLTYPDGSSPDLITVSTSVKQSDFYMIAAGFHFSSPTISLKLEKSAPAPSESPSPTPSPTPSPSSAPTLSNLPQSSASKVLTKSICVKGKVTKTVVGSKCPSGYRKK